MELHLREYTKQGVDFKRYAQDKKAQAAFVGLKEALVENAELHAPDFVKVQSYFNNLVTNLMANGGANFWQMLALTDGAQHQ